MASRPPRTRRALGPVPIDRLAGTGGAVLAGGWLEAGSAFDAPDAATVDTNVSRGAIAGTLLGPVFVGASAGWDGASRFYVGIGRIFR